MDERKEMPPPYSEQPPPIGFPTASSAAPYPVQKYDQQPAYNPAEMKMGPDGAIAPMPQAYPLPGAVVYQQPMMVAPSQQPMMITTAGGGCRAGGRQTVVTMAPLVGPESVRMTCPGCSADITTSVKKDASMMAWGIAFILCFIGCIPCCLIPFCMDGCQTVEHTCPSCKRFVGKYSRY